MKKLIKHSWKLTTPVISTTYKCQNCGCVRYWDFSYNHIMYSWGTNITYKAPQCIGMNGKPYNK